MSDTEVQAVVDVIMAWDLPKEPNYQSTKMKGINFAPGQALLGPITDQINTVLSRLNPENPRTVSATTVSRYIILCWAFQHLPDASWSGTYVSNQKALHVLEVSYGYRKYAYKTALPVVVRDRTKGLDEALRALYELNGMLAISGLDENVLDQYLDRMSRIESFLNQYK